MSIPRERIDELVRAELARPEAAYALFALADLLVDPRPTLVPWIHTDDGPFETWIVGRSADGRIELVWCDGGLGSGGYSWGAIVASEGHQGIDSQWHLRLMDAAICFRLIPPPAGYEVP